MSRRSGSRIVLSALLVLSAMVASTMAVADPGNEPGARRAGSLAVGDAPPALDLERIAGSDAVTLQGLSGRVVVLDFWATWCAPCRAVMPSLDELYRRHRDRGLTVVGLSPEPDAAIRAHLSALPVSYTIARDVGGTLQRYGVRAIPMLVVLDRAGRVREVMVGVGGDDIARLDSLVGRLLAQPARGN